MVKTAVKTYREAGQGADARLRRVDEPASATVSDRTIVEYWNERSTSYSFSVCEELGGPRCAQWERVLADGSARARASAAEAGRMPRALDLGCGPGFFSILMARLGCAVDSVDGSAGMLDQARANVARAHMADRVSFHEGDIMHLPFPDEAFDVVVLRNVTWLMRDLQAAYAEWCRVLAAGGVLLSFDANWYRYLVDPLVDARRAVDQSSTATLGQDERGLATHSQERRCEQIAFALPSTYRDRPAWDQTLLADLPFSSVEVDESVWTTVWTEGEQAFNATSPLFSIRAAKAPAAAAGVSGASSCAGCRAC